jgi:lysophospholipase L1-like esterase
MTKKVIIIGSSVSMPRNEISYEDTWVSKFITTFNNFHVIDRCRRASLSARLVNEGGETRERKNPKGSDLLEFYKPHYAIVEIGIVDASPRYFKKRSLFELFLKLASKYLNINVWHLVKKYRKRKLENTLVSPEEYMKNYKEFIKRAKKIDCLVMAIEILPPNKLFSSKNEHIGKSINIYNDILYKLEKEYDNFQLLKTSTSFRKTKFNFFIDELHLNKEGHEQLYQIVNTKFSEINE